MDAKDKELLQNTHDMTVRIEESLKFIHSSNEKRDKKIDWHDKSIIGAYAILTVLGILSTAILSLLQGSMNWIIHK